jgi:hypothetical protein
MCTCVNGSMCALQTIAQREVAALLGINSGRDAKAKKRRKQNIIVQVALLKQHPATRLSVLHHCHSIAELQMDQLTWSDCLLPCLWLDVCVEGYPKCLM